MKEETVKVKKAEKRDEQELLFNPLLNALKENDKKNLFKTNVNTAFIKTGFPLIDYYFGAVVNKHNDRGELIKQEPRIGQAAGTFNLVVGGSGSGKTTLVSQIAGNMIHQFPFANVIHFDCENRFDVSRAETITKLPPKDFADETARYIIKNGMVGLDIIQKMITDIYKEKMKLKDQLMVDTGLTDEFGKPVMMMQPTIVIIDSITTVMAETFSPDNAKDMAKVEELRSNTEGARDAKTMKGFFKDILPMCKEANIIIYGINHINTNMSMNSILPVAKQQNWLGQNESIPGGKTMIYYPFNIMKLIPKTTKVDRFEEAIDGFDGHLVRIEPIKSSSNQSGNGANGLAFDLVFSFKQGFDPLRSMILYGKNAGIIEGNKNKMKFKDDPSFTFTFRDVYKEKDKYPIWKNIVKYVIPHLDKKLSYTEPSEIRFDEESLSY